MPKITLTHVTKQWGKFIGVNDLNLEIGDGSFITLLGSSGCGKTTTLRMIAGLETPTHGEIRFDDRIMFSSEKNINIPPARREVGFLFQNYALWPHMTVTQNIAFGLETLKWKKADISARGAEMLRTMRIEQFAERYPAELSGGQQQRVAIARTLAPKPRVLFMDEPLSNLDAKLRVSMRTEIRRIQQEAGITAVYVTHDQSEAMAISDKIIIMEKGVVAQMGTPQEIYYHPDSEFVADFIGEANFLRGTLVSRDGTDGVVEIGGSRVAVCDIRQQKAGDNCTLVLRPEAAVIADKGQLPCRVVLSCFMGSYQNYHVMVGDTLVKITDFNPKNKKIYSVGDEAFVAFETESVHVL